MKITVFNAKWGAWKTPISTNIVLDRGYALGTNETYHVFNGFIPDNRLISIGLNNPFPLIDDDIDIVFDLAWSISDTALSITSAIEQSDLVIIPIYNEVKSMTWGINTLSEILALNQNVIVVATKLPTPKKVNGEVDWSSSADLASIKNAVNNATDAKIPVLPLKFSLVFDTIFEQEKSITQLMQSSGLYNYQFKEVAEQFDAIYKILWKDPVNWLAGGDWKNTYDAWVTTDITTKFKAQLNDSQSNELDNIISTWKLTNPHKKLNDTVLQQMTNKVLRIENT